MWTHLQSWTGVAATSCFNATKGRLSRLSPLWSAAQGRARVELVIERKGEPSAFVDSAGGGPTPQARPLSGDIKPCKVVQIIYIVCINHLSFNIMCWAHLLCEMLFVIVQKTSLLLFSL